MVILKTRHGPQRHRDRVLHVAMPCLAFLWLLAACKEAPSPGEPFPPLRLTALDGTQTPWRQTFLGKVIVFNIWATWCAPCRREMPALERLSHSLNPDKFAVVGLSVDHDIHLVQEFMQHHDIHFPMFMDKDHAITQKVLGIASYPQTFLITPDGVLVRRVLGEHNWDNPDIIREIEKIGAALETKP